MMGSHQETKPFTMNFIAAPALQSSAAGRFDWEESRCKLPKQRHQTQRSRNNAQTNPAHSMRLASPKRPGRRINSAWKVCGCWGATPENTGAKAHITKPARHAFRH